ncbi:MAG: ABC transporter substrate-binding protein [Pontiellaceae bacterium]|nr:ABC transporter substrate-binding protein [Pontiellaceae bacterium]
MNKRFPIFHLLLLCMLLFGCGRADRPAASNPTARRIVTLSPAATETLFDLELGDRLVGISKFSDANRELNLPIVGDFMNLNYEALYTLAPDLVILENGSDDQRTRLHQLHISTIEVASLTLNKVMESIHIIGQACGAEENAAALADTFQQQMDAARNTPDHRPRTLITFSDFSSGGEVEQVYAFGADCIHAELLEIAGGDNVITDPRPSVTLSREALIRLNPDLIIELTGSGPGNQWSNLPLVNAVRNQNIHVLDGTYTCIPSPGCLMQTLNDFSRIIRQNDFVAE